MNCFSLLLTLISTLLLLNGAVAFASESKLPVVDGEPIVAKVNDDPITLKELNNAIGLSHSKMSNENTAGRIEFSPIMKRLINARLIGIEAKNMGFSELPEIQKMIAKQSKQVMMELLLENEVKDITVDDGEVDILYKKIAKEWKLTAAEFEKEENAKKVQTELKNGAKFDDVIKKAVKDGIAKSEVKSEYIKDKDLTIPVAKLVSKMKVGSVSPIVSLDKKSFIIFRLNGFRFPEKEDAKIKQEAKNQALNQKKIQFANNYYLKLKKKYVKLNSKLFDSIDFEAKDPGFEMLLKDKRVIAQIEGDAAFTVGDLAQALKDKFYHGIDRAIGEKKVNKKKIEILEDTLQKKVLLIEASKKEMDKSSAYIDGMKEYENSLIFGMFIDKVIVPEIKINNAELKAYYDTNLESFSSPQMLRIKSLMFEDKNSAIKALDKLIKGTDFAWLNSHADGLVEKDPKEFLQFDGQLLTLNSLPADVKKVVADAKSENFRLYESDKGRYYVLYITQVIAPNPQPFESAEQAIKEAVFKEKVKKAIEDWADQLQEHYPVIIYGTDLKH
ncbi:MAG: hypothetical protein C0403_04805 [Desulfobacterium sp.]|nr:hypothetical protein [Desulfobacterium sp.]